MTNVSAAGTLTQGVLPGAEASGRYLLSGCGPTLIHLTEGTTPAWSPAHDLLARHFRVIAIGCPADAGATEAARRLTILADQLGVDRFGLWGTSGAALATLRFTLQHPDRVESLVLESPPPLWSDHSDTVDEGLRRQLGGLTVPTLALFGTAADRPIAAERRAYRRDIPSGSFVLVYAAGARISADRPEAFASVVADFVERREAFIVGRANHLIHP